MAAFPVYIQHDAMDCGPVCLRMIAKYYGRNYSLQSLRDKSYLTREGVSLRGISDAAESAGFRTLGVSITFDKLISEAPLPAIVHWKQKHFIVVYKIKKNKIYVADPAFGLIKYSLKNLLTVGSVINLMEKTKAQLCCSSLHRSSIKKRGKISIALTSNSYLLIYVPINDLLRS